MKFPLAFVLVLFLVFQITELSHAHYTATEYDDIDDEDDTVTEINLYDDRSMQNSSTGSVEESDELNNNDTFMDLDDAGQDISSNDSASEEGTGEKGQSFFHDHTEGIVVIFVIAIIIAGIFLFPVFNHCRKSYVSKKPFTPQGQPFYLPRYQELLQRDILHYDNEE